MPSTRAWDGGRTKAGGRRGRSGQNRGSLLGRRAGDPHRVVFLLGKRAYKMKKPMTTGFLDFSSPERRLAACRREGGAQPAARPRRLPRGQQRLGPELPPWTGRDADGAPVELLVVMRRMPEDRRLSTLIRAAPPVQGHVRNLARSIAAFHAAARRDPDVTAEGSRDALGGRWAANAERAREPLRSSHLRGAGPRG